jgi:hypothetical protein
MDGVLLKQHPIFIKKTLIILTETLLYQNLLHYFSSVLTFFTKL